MEFFLKAWIQFCRRLNLFAKLLICNALMHYKDLSMTENSTVKNNKWSKIPELTEVELRWLDLKHRVPGGLRSQVPPL